MYIIHVLLIFYLQKDLLEQKMDIDSLFFTFAYFTLMCVSVRNKNE